MTGHEIHLVLGVLLVACGLVWVAGRINVPYPVMLVIGGALLGISSPLVKLPVLALRPELVFLLFLPPLLYFDGTQTSWRDFRANLRAISVLAVGLVLFTTVTLAAVAHWLIDGMPWSSAFVLGAVISPTDAIAAMAITVRLNVPRRLVTILEGESLVNDATGLVAFNFAVAAVLAGTFSLPAAALRLVYVSAGGIAVGYVVARAWVWLRPRVNNLGVETALSLIVPFVAYLPADQLGVSGVLAAVTCGLYVGRKMPTIASPMSRLRSFGVWEAVVFLLNAFCFMLLGLQLPGVLRRLEEHSGWDLLYYAAAVSVAAVVVRLLWVFIATYWPRRLYPRAFAEDPAPPRRYIFFLGWTSLRGIVSLAAAMAIPLALPDGSAFPGRDLIVFITFGVIFFTLVVQGLTLPLVIRALRLPVDDQAQREERTARLETTHAAIARLEVLAVTNEDLLPGIERVRESYLERLRELAVLTGRLPQAMDGPEAADKTLRCDDVRRIAMKAERLMLVHLRDRNLIGDEALRRVQTELDLEESLLG